VERNNHYCKVCAIIITASFKPGFSSRPNNMLIIFVPIYIDQPGLINQIVTIIINTPCSLPLICAGIQIDCIAILTMQKYHKPLSHGRPYESISKIYIRFEILLTSNHHLPLQCRQCCQDQLLHNLSRGQPSPHGPQRILLPPYLLRHTSERKHAWHT